VQSLSAIDIALWDIKGKATGKPVYQLMGGAVRNQLTPYATGMYRRYTENEIIESTGEALSYAERGFKALKIKIGFGAEYDLKLVQSIRKTVGEEIQIMVDANHAYNAAAAISIGRELEQMNISWFEEPVPPEDLAGYQEVKSKLTVPISGGEAEFTRYGFQHLINNRCVDIVQPDCTITGGFSELSKIITLCSLANVQCFPHIWGSGIALAAGIQAAVSLPDFPPSLEPAPVYLEYDQTSNIFRKELAEGIPEMKNGTMSIPVKPGLGIDINEEIIRKYSV
ncbi:MAG: mandelate racemase/muconate lactonizing enzyme family protein, partial [Candidatus Thiodiazotropha endolucinida]